MEAHYEVRAYQQWNGKRVPLQVMFKTAARFEHKVVALGEAEHFAKTLPHCFVLVRLQNGEPVAAFKMIDGKMTKPNPQEVALQFGAERKQRINFLPPQKRSAYGRLA